MVVMKVRPTRVVIVVAVLILFGVVLRFTVFRSDPVPVTVFRVARGPVEETVTNSKAGTVRTRRRAVLSPEIGGRVKELAVRAGDRVHEGQVLMRLAAADYEARILLQQRAVTAAAAAQRAACLTAQQAEREHTRYLRLAEQKIIAEEVLDRLESDRDVAAATCQAAEANVHEAKAALDLAQVERAKTVLRAPFDAVVAELTAEVGEWISPSPPGLPMPAVIELIQPSAIYISAPLDEVDVGKVGVDQPVRVTLEAYPGRSLAGKVVRVAPYVLDTEEHSRTFEIEVELEDREFAQTLLPGTSADVEVILDSVADVLRIPSYALMAGGHVLLVNDGSLVARDVTTGLENWAFTEIKDGLEAGDAVVVSLDRAEIQEGAKARIADETLK